MNPEVSDHLEELIRCNIPPTQDPFVRLYKSGDFVRSYKLERGNTIVGRDPTSGIPVNDRFISRHHFVMEYLGEDALTLQDLESRNGTFVNGEQVKSIKLKHNDRIVCGVYEFVISHSAYDPEKLGMDLNIDTDKPKHGESADENDLIALEPSREIIQMSPSNLRAEVVEVPTPIAIEPVTKDVQPVLEVPSKPLDDEVSQIQGKISAPKNKTSSSPKISPPKNFSVVENTGSVQQPVTSEVDLASFKAPIPKKEPTLLKNTLISLVMVTLAGGMAYYMTNYLKLKEQQKLRDPVETSEVNTQTPLQEVAVPTVKPPSPKLIESSPKQTARPKEKETPKLPKKSKLVASLDEVLTKNKASKGLGNVDKRLKKTKETFGSVKIKTLRPEDFSVEVRLPSMKQFLTQQRQRLDSVGSGEVMPGTFDPREYQAMLRDKVGVVEKCYMDHGKNGSSGQVAVWFSIAQTGRVQKGGIESSSIGNARLEGCMVNEITKLNVDPPPWDGFTVTYKFNFQGTSTTDFTQ